MICCCNWEIFLRHFSSDFRKIGYITLSNMATIVYTYYMNVITPALFPHYIIENNLSVSCMKTGNVIEN